MAYNADSIKIKDFREACRSTPAMYLGDDGENGIFNCFLEILNNACDEAIMGRGDTIIVNLLNNNDTIQIIDFGAGIPYGPNQDCKEVLVEVFTKSHSSGKFDTSNYKKVRGIHGCGSSAVCVCSREFKVETIRDFHKYGITFIDGIPENEVAIPMGKTSIKSGTIVSFTPNKEIFHLAGNIENFNAERIRNELELTSYFIPKVHFILKSNGEELAHFYSENGVKDFAQSKIKKPLHKHYIYGYKEFEDEVEVEVIAQWTDGKEQSYVFSNGALNSEGGTPISGVKTAFTRTVNSLGKTDFDSDLIRKGLVYIVNIKHPHPIYQNQVKNKIQNAELRGYTQTVFTEAIKDFYLRYREEFDCIVELLEKETKAAAAAEKTRQAILNAGKEIEKNQKRKVFSSDKLKDAEYLGQNSVLLLCEGNSAAAAMAAARDAKKYGLLLLRGKILNCLSTTEDKIYQNDVIKLILSAMNIVPGHYDGQKLRYGKLAICTDADSDGYHIGLLIIACLQAICPQFIAEKRLGWLRSPLYIVKNGGKESYYFTDEEFNKVRSTVKGEVSRAKGLGALNATQAHNSMFTEEFQRLEILESTQAAIDLLYTLMSDDVEPRRDFVFKNIDFSEIRE